MKGVDSFFYFPTVTEDKNTELITNLDIKKLLSPWPSQQHYSRTFDVYLQYISSPMYKPMYNLYITECRHFKENQSSTTL